MKKEESKEVVISGVVDGDIEKTEYVRVYRVGSKNQHESLIKTHRIHEVYVGPDEEISREEYMALKELATKDQSVPVILEKPDEPDEIIEILQNTLDSLFEQKGIDLRHNEKLLVSLGLHLTPALDRLLEDSQIENPLTEKIKERHPKEFAMAEILNDAIESIYHKRFTEDEVAYFALHFIVSARQK